MSRLLRFPDDRRLACDAGRPQEDSREELVARARKRDQRSNERRTDDVEPEGREVLAGADRERKRQRSDEKYARDDTACAFASLTRRVQPSLPEDEEQQQDQERQPVALLVPDEPPEDRVRIEEVCPQAEGGVETEHEADEVDDHQREDARHPARDRPPGRDGQKVRPPEANVLERD